METWQMPFNGRHWYDMPGYGQDEKKLNFAAWRRGLIKMEEIQRDVAHSDGGGISMVAVPELKTGLAHANYRRAVAAAKRGPKKLKQVTWNDSLKPSERREKVRAVNAQAGRRLRERVAQNARQQGLKRRFEEIRGRCYIADKPLQMMRDAWREMGGNSWRAENLLHNNAVLFDEAEARLFDQALDLLEARVSEAVAMRARAVMLARGLDLLGVRGIDFCAACGVSDQLLRDLRRDRFRVGGEKLRAIMAELERLTAKGGAVQ